MRKRRRLATRNVWKPVTAEEPPPGDWKGRVFAEGAPPEKGAFWFTRRKANGNFQHDGEHLDASDVTYFCEEVQPTLNEAEVIPF